MEEAKYDEKSLDIEYNQIKATEEPFTLSSRLDCQREVSCCSPNPMVQLSA